MRILLSLLIFSAIQFQPISLVLGQSDIPGRVAQVKGMPGVVVLEKEGDLIGVDFRKCDDQWVLVFPNLLEIPTLQSVTMTGPLATHTRVAALAALPNLRSLRLDQSPISDETVETIWGFAKVEDVNFEGCNISDVAFRNVSKCTTIKRLRVAKTQITDAGLAHLRELQQLELLDLSECVRVTNLGLAHLRGLVKLRNLSVGSPLITNEGLANFSGMTNMVAIAIKECAVTDEGFIALAGMTKLTEFDIFKTPAGDRALEVVSNAKNIAKLKLRGSGVTNDGLVAHIAKFENLVSLDLGETETSDRALAAIGKLKKLEDLNLLRTKGTDAGVASLVGLKLKRLNLDDIQAIGDGVVPHVAKMPSLEFLHLGKTSITDEGLQGLAALVNLKDLILTNTAVSKRARQELQSRLPKAKILGE